MSIDTIIFYLLLIDSLGANFVAWFGEKWYTRNFRIFSRYFPVSKGWCFYYLILVLWAGSILCRAGMLF